MPSLLILRDNISWFGAHSGYEQLTRFIADGCYCSVVNLRRGQFARYLGSAYARLQGRPGRGPLDLGELEFRLQHRFRRPDLSHILYLERHLDLLKTWPAAQNDLIGTIHQPASAWKPEQLRLLSRLRSAFVLYQRDASFFEEHLGKNRVRFIHYGTDTEFFRPDPTKLQMPPRILYSGVHLRNELMLVRIVQRISEKLPEIQFDLLVPRHHRASSALSPLQQHPAVTWHAGLDDAALRALYQRSFLLLLPMNESGANTAVVEALACGLPIVTTDVGGIRDYGGGTVFPVVANNDDDAMLDLIEEYLLHPIRRDETGERCRRFAEETLHWPRIADKHLEIYEEGVRSTSGELI